MAETWSIFDVIGPVMIGPSSSHTAGACFIGYIARQIFNDEPEEVLIRLHGSFGEVYKGHGTDHALLAGILNMPPHDPNLSKSMEIATKKGIKFSFESCNLAPYVHPNTALIELIKGDKRISVQGESIGGGKCRITEIDKIPVVVGPEKSCLIIKYVNEKSENNILSQILKIINDFKLDIAEIETPTYKDRTIAVIKTRELLNNDIIKKLEKLPGVLWASFSNHISNYGQEY